MKPASARLFTFVAAAIAIFPLAGVAQQPKKLPTVGWLQNYSSAFPAYEGFRQGLRELGYREGQNLIVEAREARGNLDLLTELARELVRVNVDVLYVGGDQGLRAAKQATATIPIVVLACDPLDSLIVSIARPGGSATGLTCISSDLAGKRLELLREFVPGLSRVAVLYNPKDLNKQPEYVLLQRAARPLGVTAEPFEAAQASELNLAFAGMSRRQAQGLIILADAWMNANAKGLADLALANRLPAIYGFREFTDAGGLASYGASLREEHRLAAAYIHKILKGAKPGDLPVQEPTKFELVISLRTAKALDLTVPQSLLARADEVIE